MRKYLSKYLGVADLEEREHVCTIEEVTVTEYEDGTIAPLVKFKQFDKAFGLNKTCTNVLIELFGHESDEWIGQRVTLYPTTTEFKGKNCPCIRVKPVRMKTRRKKKVRRNGQP